MIWILTILRITVLARLSSGYPQLKGRLPTCYSPVRHSDSKLSSFDLHVLGTPPAFILSQDQTLKNLYSSSKIILVLKN